MIQSKNGVLSVTLLGVCAGTSQGVSSLLFCKNNHLNGTGCMVEGRKLMVCGQKGKCR